MDRHIFRRSFRWYQPRCSPMTGTLGTFEVLDSDHENHEKSMFIKLLKEAFGGIRESLDIIWGICKYSWMIHDYFDEVQKMTRRADFRTVLFSERNTRVVIRRASSIQLRLEE